MCGSSGREIAVRRKQRVRRRAIAGARRWSWGWSCWAPSGWRRARSSCSCSITVFSPSKATIARCAWSRSRRTAARSPIATASRWQSARRSTACGSIPRSSTTTSISCRSSRKALKEDQQTLARRITSNLDREFLYLVRHMPPEQAARIKALGIPGVYLLREYRRYYPAGEVSGARRRIHHCRRQGPGGPGARLRPIAERRGRREARHPGPATAATSRMSKASARRVRAAIWSPASICASSIWRTAN